MELAFIVGCLAVAAAQPNDRARFDAWMRDYAVEIDAGDYERRLDIFAEKLRSIEAHDSSDFRLGLNRFSHLTEDEFASMYRRPMSRVPTPPVDGAAAAETPDSPPVVVAAAAETLDSVDGAAAPETPASVDWVAEGVVTRVYEQGACAACWTFAASGALEGAFALATGRKGANLTAFSQQQIVECDNITWHGKRVDNGCHGTWYGMDSAYTYIETNGGLCTEAAYPYVGANSTDWTTCHVSENGCAIVPGSAPANHTDVAPASEAALAAAVAKQPVSVVVDASCQGFMSYAGGVWTKDCGTKLDHAVLVVGYGFDAPSNTSYWKVKNSWGAAWGEAGYVRLARGLAGAGGHGIMDIASTASYPTFA